VPTARQLILACIEFPEIAAAHAEMLTEMGFGPLDSLRDAILDACFSGEVLPDGGLRDGLVRRGFGPDLARLDPDRGPMVASLGGEDADAKIRDESWRRLAASYIERVAEDTRTAEERTRQAHVFEQGDPQAFQSFLAAVRRGKKR
jgi:DNA primase